ncbi:MAG: hypothetical protein HQM04_19335 [Magnetococcales bacterium]|nr:hypothetical protein [Magnetococcales bacterium]MBF0117179.1 hypothetical protein [Magnetococcales bacterium]
MSNHNHPYLTTPDGSVILPAWMVAAIQESLDAPIVDFNPDLFLAECRAEFPRTHQGEAA